MNKPEEIIRLNVEVSMSLHEKIKDCVPWGVKSKLIRALLEALIEGIDTQGYQMIASLLEGNVELIIMPPDVQNLDTPAEDE